jgi:TolA-binding protein
MSKRILFISAVFLSLLSLSSVCIADVTEQLKQAKDYRDIGDYSQAVSIYQSVISSNPGTNAAFKAQREIAALEVLQGKETEALAAYQALLTNYSDNESIANAVARVGDAYCKIKDYEKAAQLYQYSLSNWPNASGAMNSHCGLAVLGVLQNNDNAVTAAVDKIVSDFSGNKKFGKTVYEIGLQCFDSEKYDLAETVYQKFMTSHSNSEQAIKPLAGIALLNFHRGDNTNAQAAINKLKTDFAGNADLPMVLYDVARLCERSDKDTEAAGIYQQVITNYPGTDWAERAHLDLACMNVADLVGQGNESEAETAYKNLFARLHRGNTGPYHNVWVI